MGRGSKFRQSSSRILVYVTKEDWDMKALWEKQSMRRRGNEIPRRKKYVIGGALFLISHRSSGIQKWWETSSIQAPELMLV